MSTLTDPVQPVGGSAPARPWHLYLIECRNGALYAGITNDVPSRYAAHARGRGAKFTRANPPVQLVGSRLFPDRSSAAKAEFAIRRLRPMAKRQYIHE